MDSALKAGEKMHNEFRRRHSALPLKLDAKLNEGAQKYAEAIISGAEIPQDENSSLGMNQYESTGEEGEELKVVVKDAVAEWYNHIRKYDWKLPTQSKNSATLFSNIVWKSTTQIGIGIAKKKDKLVVVALYSPPSDLSSDQQYQQNVDKAQW